MSATDVEPFDPRPGRASVLLSIAGALLTVVVSAATLPAAALGLAGLVLLPIGVQRGSRLVHRLGSAALFSAVVIAGAAGLAPLAMLVAAGAAVVAWDAGEQGIGLGEQLGRAAATTRVQVVHTGATVAVGALVGVVGYAVYDVATAGQPTTAIALLVGAAILFTYLLER